MRAQHPAFASLDTPEFRAACRAFVAAMTELHRAVVEGGIKAGRLAAEAFERNRAMIQRVNETRSGGLPAPRSVPVLSDTVPGGALHAPNMTEPRP